MKVLASLNDTYLQMDVMIYGNYINEYIICDYLTY